MGKKREQDPSSEEQKTRKTAVVQAAEEEVKLTPEELYEIELKETQERQ